MSLVEEAEALGLCRTPVERIQEICDAKKHIPIFEMILTKDEMSYISPFMVLMNLKKVGVSINSQWLNSLLPDIVESQRSFVASFAQRRKDYASVPDWVVKYKCIAYPRPPRLKTIRREDIDILANTSVVSEVPEVTEMTWKLANLGVNMAGDTAMHLHYGPLNAIPDHVCNSRTDGCRMLLCVCHEEKGDEWFTGECEICERDIRSPKHAIRFPMDEGGWYGCFCSPEHLKIGRSEFELQRITEYVDQINKIGIIDDL